MTLGETVRTVQMRFPVTDLVVSLVPLFALFYCIVIFDLFPNKDLE